MKTESPYPLLLQQPTGCMLWWFCVQLIGQFLISL